MTLENSQIEEFKQKLLIEKSGLEQELGIIATSPEGGKSYSTKFNEIGTDEDDNASEIEEYTDNLAIEGSLEKQLKAINAALERIKEGTYGSCSNCKTSIGIERLSAYPAAATCVKCS